MKENYDFSKSIRNPFIDLKRSPKKEITLELDEETIRFFEELAKENDLPCNVFINTVLNKYIHEYKST